MPITLPAVKMLVVAEVANRSLVKCVRSFVGWLVSWLVESVNWRKERSRMRIIIMPFLKIINILMKFLIMMACLSFNTTNNNKHNMLRRQIEPWQWREKRNVHLYEWANFNVQNNKNIGRGRRTSSRIYKHLYIHFSVVNLAFSQRAGNNLC